MEDETQLGSRWPAGILNCIEQRKGERKATGQGNTFWGLMELKQGGTGEGRVTEWTSGHEQLGRCLAESKAQC